MWKCIAFIFRAEGPEHRTLHTEVSVKQKLSMRCRAEDEERRELSMVMSDGCWDSSVTEGARAGQVQVDFAGLQAFTNPDGSDIAEAM